MTAPFTVCVLRAPSTRRVIAPHPPHPATLPPEPITVERVLWSEHPGHVTVEAYAAFLRDQNNRAALAEIGAVDDFGRVRDQLGDRFEDWIDLPDDGGGS